MVPFFLSCIFLILPAFLVYRLKPPADVPVDPGKLRKMRKLIAWDCVFFLVIYLILSLLNLWTARAPSAEEETGFVRYLMTWDDRFMSPIFFFAFLPWMFFFGYLFYIYRGEREKPEGVPVRGASLVPRQRQNPIKLFHWGVVWFVWLAGIGAIIALFAVSETQDRNMHRMLLVFSLFIQVSEVIILFTGPVMTRQILMHEPETLPPEENEVLRQAYERHRKANAWMTYWGLLFVVLFTSTVSAAMVANLSQRKLHQTLIAMGGVLILLGLILVLGYIRRRRKLDHLFKTSMKVC